MSKLTRTGIEPSVAPHPPAVSAIPPQAHPLSIRALGEVPLSNRFNPQQEMPWQTVDGEPVPGRAPASRTQDEVGGFDGRTNGVMEDSKETRPGWARAERENAIGRIFRAMKRGDA